ncbi:flavin reductase family protein [Limnohabitans sp. Rim11]|jgi:flavin reductase (DIM6/NTAB) family NADH-FMN oxidoreductase RutF|uniref:flavin reductase family protein n=1 Tax=Limnohabitans sp. Rim11 TaxID=1100719 RepID=UPI000AAD9AE3|nr:flavin reductase family protein [Limnohabitans sp. Rim11]
MQVHLTNAGAVTLLYPTVFNQLDVLVDPQSPEKLAQAIARIGHSEGNDHVRLTPSVLRFLSGHAGETEWEAGFSAMLNYAAKKGWVNASGEIRAHLIVKKNEALISADDFKAAMRALPAGIAAITTAFNSDVAGMIVSSLTSVSADPPMVGFFAHQNSSIHTTLLKSGRFVANILGEDHRDLMSVFLQQPQGTARFNTGHWQLNEQEVPVLQNALASLDCEIVLTQKLGTHFLIVGKVQKSSHAYGNPMVNFNASTHLLATEFVN